MKRKLTIDDVKAAVMGGAILGGGGGGIIEAGERAASLALQLGTPELWSVDEFDARDLSVTVALVGAPAAPNPLVQPRHLMRTLELLQRELPAGSRLAAMHTNENGAETTVNGWVHAALCGLPLIDLACNGRAHPSSVMGALGLHKESDYLSIQGYAGGAPERYIEGVASGRLEATSAVVRRASIDAGGLVAVARNPVTVGYAQQHGAPGAISFAIALGKAYLDGGMDGAARHLNGRFIAQGTVRRYRCEQREGLDVGIVELDDDGATTLHFVNEYMVLEQQGRAAAAFPDLVMTFGEDGHPLVSARVAEGQRIRVLHAPGSNLLLSRTMFMPELYQPLEAAIGQAFAPRAGADAVHA
ncbi:DUF917 family protein [Variovorax sp.]|uniref:S-methyl thiohydantoin desulfurase domain-containing protein n=1 Tax=Variovorax sp. TaxID=1871043 RepID=UPI002D5EB6F4|nr:DUF917 family protein [Variovorax sp.]HYP83637.1 DUF917 family protein [Variovorax sp.]